MDEALFIPSAVLSAVLVLCYICVCIKRKAKIDQKPITNLILQAFQIVCGLVLIASTFFSELETLVKDLNLYVLIAGAVLLINSSQSAISEVQSVKQNKEANRSQVSE